MAHPKQRKGKDSMTHNPAALRPRHLTVSATSPDGDGIAAVLTATADNGTTVALLLTPSDLADLHSQTVAVRDGLIRDALSSQMDRALGLLGGGAA
jgi:hypothetical protein